MHDFNTPLEKNREKKLKEEGLWFEDDDEND